MKFATLALLVVAASAQDTMEDDMMADDSCECVGAENLPTDFFVEQGYPAEYGTECNAWDAAEDYCLEGGDSFGEDWCEDTYIWCYVSVDCESGLDTVFFAETEYAGTLAYSAEACSEMDGASQLFLSAVTASVAAIALYM